MAIDCVGEWKLDEGIELKGINANAGDLVNDTSGNGNTGTISGDPVWQSGVNGYSALDFDGVDDYVEVADSDTLDITDAITVEAWVSLKGGSQTMIRKNGNDWLLEWVGTMPQWGVLTSDGWYLLNGSGDYASLNLNQWYHIIGTYNGVESKIYIDGQEAATPISCSGTIITSDSFLRIGNWAGEIFNGFIDEVRIYSEALSAEQIKENYLAGLETHQNIVKK